MPPALLEFLKKNAKFAYGGGILGGMLVASDVKRVSDADNKLKALLKVFKDFLLIRVAMSAIFPVIASGLRSLVRETGSLEAALKRIQQLQMGARILAPFVGGLAAARTRMAELVTLSQRGPFKFEDIAEANKSLTIFTKGAYASVDAMKQISMVAIGTGNNVQDVANAVGMFYDDLAEGRPVERSTKAMREMGIISDSTAKQLDAMAEGGHNVSAVMDELQSSLQSTAQFAKGFEDDISTINAEHEKAVEEFKQKIGAPWTEHEIQNTKNMTAAIRGITPAVGAVSKSFAAVFNGFTTVKTSLVKMVAESETASTAMKALGKAIEIASVAGVIFGTVAAVQVSRGIMGMLPGLTAMGGRFAMLRLAIQGLLLGGVWTVVAAGIAGVVGAIVNSRREAHETDQKFKEWKRTLHDTTASIKAQAAAVTTLAERNAVLNKILDAQIANEKELAAERAKTKTPRQEQLERTLKAHPEIQGAAKRRIVEQIEEERKRVPTKEDEKERIRKAGIEEGYLGQKRAKRDIEIAHAKERQIQAANRDYEEMYAELSKQDPLEKSLIEAEARKSFLIEQQTRGIQAREKVAREGLDSTAAAEKESAKLDADKFKMQKSLAKDRAQFAEDIKIKKGEPGYVTQQERQDRKENFRKRQEDIVNIENQQIQAGERVSQKQSVAYLQSRLTRIEFAKEANAAQARYDETTNERDKKFWKEKVDRAKTLAAGETFTPKKEYEAKLALEAQKLREAQAPELGAEVPRVKAEQEIFAKETEATTARAAGDIRKAFKLEDLTKFARTFEGLKSTFGPEAAEKMARERTEADIKEQYAQAGNVVGYLQSVGGGGGLPQQGVDLQRRMVDLLSSINEYNKKMAEGTPTTDNSSQGTPAFFFNP